MQPHCCYGARGALCASQAPAHMLQAAVGQILYAGNQGALRWRPPSPDHFGPCGLQLQTPPSGPQVRISAGLCRGRSAQTEVPARAMSLGQNKPFREQQSDAGPARWQIEWGGCALKGFLINPIGLIGFAPEQLNAFSDFVVVLEDPAHLAQLETFAIGGL